MSLRLLIPSLLLASTSSFAGAETLYREARYDLQPAVAPSTAAENEKPARFGAEGKDWITIGTGFTHDFSGNAGYDLHVSWSTFVFEDVEFSLELATWFYEQRGTNAFGLNPQFVFRYHFYKSPDAKWTVFAEAGIGLLFTDHDVPKGGTAFGFTPRVGGGFTRELTDDGLRLQVGLRWAHISNARINGDSRNPSRDSLMIYAGLMFPF